MSLRRKIISAIMIVFGLVMVGGAIIQISEGTSKYPLGTDLVVMTLFGILPASVGVWFLVEGSKAVKRKASNETEISLLKQAQTQDGRITITEAAVAIQQSISEAKTVLDKMQSKGIFEIAITENGTLVYVICESLDYIKPKKGTDLV